MFILGGERAHASGGGAERERERETESEAGSDSELSAQSLMWVSNSGTKFTGIL